MDFLNVFGNTFSLVTGFTGAIAGNKLAGWTVATVLAFFYGKDWVTVLFKKLTDPLVRSFELWLFDKFSRVPKYDKDLIFAALIWIQKKYGLQDDLLIKREKFIAFVVSHYGVERATAEKLADAFYGLYNGLKSDVKTLLTD